MVARLRALLQWRHVVGDVSRCTRSGGLHDERAPHPRCRAGNSGEDDILRFEFGGGHGWNQCRCNRSLSAVGLVRRQGQVALVGPQPSPGYGLSGGGALLPEALPSAFPGVPPGPPPRFGQHHGRLCRLALPPCETARGLPRGGPTRGFQGGALLRRLCCFPLHQDADVHPHKPVRQVDGHRAWHLSLVLREGETRVDDWSVLVLLQRVHERNVCCLPESAVQCWTLRHQRVSPRRKLPTFLSRQGTKDSRPLAPRRHRALVPPRPRDVPGRSAMRWRHPPREGGGTPLRQPSSQR
mmetsp:Transcript_90716/g.189625  ORF Transcript_90716/g.189625 Transcript_90716/m.189625 type:complete len:296 (-) Transcript_90716:440-1327(-)